MPYDAIFGREFRWIIHGCTRYLSHGRHDQILEFSQTEIADFHLGQVVGYLIEESRYACDMTDKMSLTSIFPGLISLWHKLLLWI